MYVRIMDILDEYLTVPLKFFESYRAVGQASALSTGVQQSSIRSDRHRLHGKFRFDWRMVQVKPLYADFYNRLPSLKLAPHRQHMSRTPNYRRVQ